MRLEFLMFTRKIDRAKRATVVATETNPAGFRIILTRHDTGKPKNSYTRVGAISHTTMSHERENKPDDPQRGGLAIEKAKPKVKKPRLYKVLLINDDFTPMEFVVTVLEQFFQMPRETAVRVMLNVHQKGMGVCGVFTVEIAEMKVRQVLDYAQEHQHPLQCTMEPD